MNEQGRMRLDAYYGSLARVKLSEALAALLAAQEYLMKARAGSYLGPHLVRRIQRSITSIRGVQDSVLNCEVVP